MTPEQLEKLFKDQKVINVSFNYSEFEIEFDNGILVTVGHTTEWDCSVWDIDANVEKEKKFSKWEQQ